MCLEGDLNSLKVALNNFIIMVFSSLAVPGYGPSRPEGGGAQSSI